ncbi:hypothetical protein [Undibacterium sp. Ji49W]|uniref:hypothetical protein n=1 Tax=Undibacterium sp. Ji49W TaxID=3413040 RepID=UPI003BF2E716
MKYFLALLFALNVMSAFADTPLQPLTVLRGVSDDRELRVRRADDVMFFYDIRTAREIKK